MSGFTDGMIVLNEGWHFLNKPFVGSRLRSLVSGLLSPEKRSRFSTGGSGNPASAWILEGRQPGL
jgi:hypothetical protein